MGGGDEPIPDEAPLRRTSWPIVPLFIAFLLLPHWGGEIAILDNQGGLRELFCGAPQVPLMLRLVEAYVMRERSRAWIGYLVFAAITPVIAFTVVELLHPLVLLLNGP